jgi:hypothetical protein
MTLPEYVIATGIGSILVVALMSLSMYSSRTFAGLANYIELNARSVRALDELTREIRRCVSVTKSYPDQLILNDGTNATGLIITYDNLNRVLMCSRQGRSTPILTGCDSVQFALYQRTPLAGTYDQYPAAGAADAKVIAIKWTCSRTVLGVKANTESEQEAKIVMRKR